jgi:hypothetical protein
VNGPDNAADACLQQAGRLSAAFISYLSGLPDNRLQIRYQY